MRERSLGSESSLWRVCVCAIVMIFVCSSSICAWSLQFTGLTKAPGRHVAAPENKRAPNARERELAHHLPDGEQRGPDGKGGGGRDLVHAPERRHRAARRREEMRERRGLRARR